MPRTTESTAIWLYAVLARDALDFADFVKEEKNDEAIKLLYLMLTTPNDKHDASTNELNAIGGTFVRRQLKERGLELPEPPYPTRWERLLQAGDFDDA